MIEEKTGQAIRVLALVNEKRGMMPAFTFLARRGYQLKICLTVTDTIQQMTAIRPHVLLLSWDLRRTDVKKIYTLLTSKFNIICIVFAETNTTKSSAALMSSGIANTLLPPVSGPGMHMRIQALLRIKNQALEKKKERRTFNPNQISETNKKDNYGTFRVKSEGIPQETQWERVSGEKGELGSGGNKTLWKGMVAGNKDAVFYFQGSKTPLFDSSKKGWTSQDGDQSVFMQGTFETDLSVVQAGLREELTAIDYTRKRKPGRNEGPSIAQGQEIDDDTLLEATISSFQAAELAAVQKALNAKDMSATQEGLDGTDFSALEGALGDGKNSGPSPGSVPAQAGDPEIQTALQQMADPEFDWKSATAEIEDELKAIEANIMDEFSTDSQEEEKKAAGQAAGKDSEGDEVEATSFEAANHEEKAEHRKSKKKTAKRRTRHPGSQEDSGYEDGNDFDSFSQDDRTDDDAESPEKSAKSAGDRTDGTEEKEDSAKKSSRAVARKKSYGEIDEADAASLPEIEAQSDAKSEADSESPTDLEPKQEDDTQPDPEHDFEKDPQGHLSRQRNKKNKKGGHPESPDRPDKAFGDPEGFHGETNQDTQRGTEKRPARTTTMTVKDERTVLARATEAAVAYCSAPSQDAPEKMAPVSKVCVAMIQSSRFMGFLYYVNSQNIHDTDFMHRVHERVKSNMIGFGVPLEHVTETLQINVEPVDFKVWADAHADFAVTSQHVNDQVVFAYLSIDHVPKVIDEGNSKTVAISIERDLVGQTELLFDVYLHMPKNDKYLRYLKTGATITTSTINKLLGFGIKHVYIVPADKDMFLAYCARNRLQQSIQAVRDLSAAS